MVNMSSAFSTFHWRAWQKRKKVGLLSHQSSSTPASAIAWPRVRGGSGVGTGVGLGLGSAVAWRELRGRGLGLGLGLGPELGLGLGSEFG